MTRKQMEQKIEELSAELAELKKNQQPGHCCHGCTCVHWHYWPVQTTSTYTLPAYVTTTSGWTGNYQITSGGI